MATMRTFLPTPTKFGSRKVEFWNGRQAKQEPGKHRGKASAGSLQVSKMELEVLALQSEKPSLQPHKNLPSMAISRLFLNILR